MAWKGLNSSLTWGAVATAVAWDMADRWVGGAGRVGAAGARAHYSIRRRGAGEPLPERPAGRSAPALSIPFEKTTCGRALTPHAGPVCDRRRVNAGPLLRHLVLRAPNWVGDLVI